MPLGSFGELNSPICCTDMEFTSAASRQQRQQVRKADPGHDRHPWCPRCEWPRELVRPGMRLDLNVAPSGPPGRYADILLTSVSCDGTGSEAKAFTCLFTASVQSCDPLVLIMFLPERLRPLCRFCQWICSVCRDFQILCKGDQCGSASVVQPDMCLQCGSASYPLVLCDQCLTTRTRESQRCPCLSVSFCGRTQ